MGCTLLDPRSVVDGPEFEWLKQKAPLAWVRHAVEFVEQHFVVELNEGHHTAFQFCKFMADLNIVFLQDAAALLMKFPERSAGAVFKMRVAVSGS